MCVDVDVGVDVGVSVGVVGASGTSSFENVLASFQV